MKWVEWLCKLGEIDCFGIGMGEERAQALGKQQGGQMRFWKASHPAASKVRPPQLCAPHARHIPVTDVKTMPATTRYEGSFPARWCFTSALGRINCGQRGGRGNGSQR